MMSLWGVDKDRVLIGCISRMFSFFRNLTLITGIPIQIAQSYVIISWLKHE